MTSPFSNQQPEPTEDDLVGLDRPATPGGAAASTGSSDWLSGARTREVVRPGAVTAALVIMWISNVLGAFLVIIGLAALGSVNVGDSAEGAALQSAAIFLLLISAALVVVQVVATVVTGRGRKWGRILLTVLLVIDMVLKVAQLAENPSGFVGLLLDVLVVVLLFRPQSSAWFDAKN